MTDHTDPDHVAEQTELWRRIREAFEERRLRDPLFCVRCGLDGLVIAHVVSLEAMVEHAESDEERRELEVAIAQVQTARLSQSAEHRGTGQVDKVSGGRVT